MDPPVYSRLREQVLNISPLPVGAIKPGTLRKYRSRLLDFAAWVRSNEPQAYPAELDRLLVEYFESLMTMTPGAGLARGQ